MNLDNILGQTLRGGASSDSGGGIELLQNLYKNEDFLGVIESCTSANINKWNEDIGTLFLKSFIHVYGEDESIIKDILCIIFSKMECIEFIGLGRFKLELSRDEVSKILLGKEEIANWKERIIIEKGDFRFVFENVERLRNDYKIENPTRDSICLFLLSCFELYELKSEYYPLHKWLFNLHFKSHH